MKEKRVAFRFQFFVKVSESSETKQNVIEWHVNVDSIKKSKGGKVLEENASSRRRHVGGVCCVRKMMYRRRSLESFGSSELAKHVTFFQLKISHCVW